MLEQIVREVNNERIVSPLFSGPMFNNMNNANRMGGGTGGGMGEPTNNGPDYSYGATNPTYNPNARISERQGPNVKFSHGYDLPKTKVQLHIHEDENGCFSHFKDYNREKIGQTLNSYETAMADFIANNEDFLKKIMDK